MATGQWKQGCFGATMNQLGEERQFNQVTSPLGE